MTSHQTSTLMRLQRDILALQGLKKNAATLSAGLGLGSMNAAFPGGCFPLAAVHEFCCKDRETQAATAGFIAGLLSPLMKHKGTAIWISPARMMFPPALAMFGIEPDRVLFIELTREKDQLWMMEEALKCESLTAVVGEIRNLDFTASRRLQLAVERSSVTGFVVRRTAKPNTTACVSRWNIRSLASDTGDGLPGIGYPRWQADLVKIRNGKPGSWQMEWRGNRFHELVQEQIASYETTRQAS